MALRSTEPSLRLVRLYLTHIHHSDKCQPFKVCGGGGGGLGQKESCNKKRHLSDGTFSVYTIIKSNTGLYSPNAWLPFLNDLYRLPSVGELLIVAFRAPLCVSQTVNVYTQYMETPVPEGQRAGLSNHTLQGCQRHR